MPGEEILWILCHQFGHILLRNQPEGTVGSKSQASSQKKAEVVNKGDYYSIQGKYDEIVIANKHYPLSKDYNPGENPTAKAELLKLIAAMQAAGYPISDHYSGFRSYETQTKLYQDYVNQDGKEALRGAGEAFHS